MPPGPGLFDFLLSYVAYVVKTQKLVPPFFPMIGFRHGECMCLLLPQLEHGLRRVFAAANQCAERVVTAESAEFFTTFEEMLVKTLPDGRPNQLLNVLPEQYIVRQDSLFMALEIYFRNNWC